MTTPHHRPRGTETQSRILERAVQIASVEGLDAMSLATLAEATQMSKSGLFAHFRSKEALQIAIVEEAERMFRVAVIDQAAGKVGFERLTVLVQSYCDYAVGTLFQGGCFFAAAVHEFDGRPGLVRDRLSVFLAMWNREIKDAVEAAQQRNEMITSTTGAAIAFWVAGVGLSLNWNAQMGNREEAIMLGKDQVANFLRYLQQGKV
ncbi:MAG: TetR/AcrR family transcriptional regulator [Deltaproteobacteria bacterium]|nr:TetR/AcrR family transcriptional regulator [Deltaproteobacteria bacterium]